MDYNQEQYFRGKMPLWRYNDPYGQNGVYLPQQSRYLTELEYEKDMERMKELYPRSIRRIVELVEDACDRMEYDGSLMFDEYPDRLMLERVIGRISRTLREEQESGDAGGPGTADGMEKEPQDAIWCLIAVVLNAEMYRRRCRRRRYRCW